MGGREGEDRLSDGAVGGYGYAKGINATFVYYICVVFRYIFPTFGKHLW